MVDWNNYAFFSLSSVVSWSFRSLGLSLLISLSFNGQLAGRVRKTVLSWENLNRCVRYVWWTEATIALQKSVRLVRVSILTLKSNASSKPLLKSLFHLHVWHFCSSLTEFYQYLLTFSAKQFYRRFREYSRGW